MSDDYVTRIEPFLERHRIETYRFEKQARHRAVVVAHRGKETTIIFPVSGSDWRGPRNAVTSLRRALRDALDKAIESAAGARDK